MSRGFPRTAEHVSAGHPDKFCDQVADRYLDEVLKLTGDDLDHRRALRTAIECLAKDNLLVITGEVKLRPDVAATVDPVALAREVWREIGYPCDDGVENLTVIDHIRSQSADIALGTDVGGAGDQGIMVGYATDETAEMMPREYVLARNLITTLREHQLSGHLPWLRADCKSQVSIDPQGDVASVIVAAQHAEDVSHDDVVEAVYRDVVVPVVGEVSRDQVKINGTGRFTIGGPTGDAGVVGRKIVVDAYGPRVAVGGGAYSGKDASKVDRSAAYMCRHIAKTIVATGRAKACTVKLAYGIGLHQPEMVTAVTETGEDLSAWVRDAFEDLSPTGIIDHLGMLVPDGWSYHQSARHGHYGRDIFPWEKVADV